MSYEPIKVENEIFYHIQKVNRNWHVGDKIQVGNDLNFQQSLVEYVFEYQNSSTGESINAGALLEDMTNFLNTGRKNIPWYHYDLLKAFYECKGLLMNNNFLLMETIFEQVRKVYFPEFPSREKGFWMMEPNLDALGYFWNCIIRVRSTKEDSKIIKLRAFGKAHKGYVSLSHRDNGIPNIKALKQLAFDYWSGAPGDTLRYIPALPGDYWYMSRTRSLESFAEILFEGTIEILEIRDISEFEVIPFLPGFSIKNDFFEPVRRIWLDVLNVNAIRNPETPHGLLHWSRVEKNGLSLADRTGANKATVSLFALFHDFARIGDEDPDHGRRAADLLKAMRPSGLDPEFDKLLYAIAKHADGETNDDPTIGTCWDADRLDLPRVGVTPKIELLNTEAAKEIVLSKP